MAKVLIKVISIALCAVMVVGCCFVGCNTVTVNDVSLAQLFEALKTEYPDAHIFSGTVYNDSGEIEIGESTEIFLSDGCKGTYVGRFLFDYGDLNEYNTSNDLRKNDIQIKNIKTESDFMRILNVVMPLYCNKWNKETTNSCLEHCKPNADFTKWENPKSFVYGGIKIYGINSNDEMGLIINL